MGALPSWCRLRAQEVRLCHYTGHGCGAELVDRRGCQTLLDTRKKDLRGSDTEKTRDSHRARVQSNKANLIRKSNEAYICTNERTRYTNQNGCAIVIAEVDSPRRWFRCPFSLFSKVVFGNIPGGGMSRSASLTINLVLDVFDVNGIAVSEDMSERMKIVDLSQVRRTTRSTFLLF